MVSTLFRSSDVIYIFSWLNKLTGEFEISQPFGGPTAKNFKNTPQRCQRQRRQPALPRFTWEKSIQTILAKICGAINQLNPPLKNKNLTIEINC